MRPIYLPKCMWCSVSNMPRTYMFCFPIKDISKNRIEKVVLKPNPFQYHAVTMIGIVHNSLNASETYFLPWLCVWTADGATFRFCMASVVFRNRTVTLRFYQGRTGTVLYARHIVQCSHEVTFIYINQCIKWHVWVFLFTAGFDLFCALLVFLHLTLFNISALTIVTENGVNLVLTSTVISTPYLKVSNRYSV